MRRLISFILLFTLCLAGSAVAQKPYFNYETKTRGDELSFPIFNAGANASVTNKINRLLQLSELQMLAGYERKDIFEELTRYQDEGFEGASNISFEVNGNSSRVLSVTFEISYSAATWHYTNKCYNFNAQTGDVIELTDIMTSKGYLSFREAVDKRWEAMVNKQITQAATDTEKEDFNGLIENMESMPTLDFYITDNVLMLDARNCFTKQQRVMGVENLIDFDVKTIAPYLNDYGKSIFGLDNKDVGGYTSASLPQLFEGTIAGKDVLMVLDGYEDYMNATYAYTDYGVGIFMEGDFNDGVLQLTETDDDGREVGTITATFEDNTIKGTCKSADGKKSYPVLLKKG